VAKRRLVLLLLRPLTLLSKVGRQTVVDRRRLVLGSSCSSGCSGGGDDGVRLVRGLSVVLLRCYLLQLVSLLAGEETETLL
jgi:hypothetical protein